MATKAATDETSRDSAGAENRHESSPTDADLSPTSLEAHPVVFFDGVCGLCNRLVDFLLRRDAGGVFRFAPLQGEMARAQLPAGDVESLQTIVLLDERGEHRRSRAVVRILWRLGGAWKLAAALFWIIPAPVRDFGYRLMSRTRYRVFGKRETCRMPTPDERERFLP